MNENKEIVIIYNKYTCEIVQIKHQVIPIIDPNVVFDDFCNKKSNIALGGKDKFDYVVVEKKDFDKYIEDINFRKLIIDPVEKKAKFPLRVNTRHNITYQIQEYKRNYSVDDIHRMYNDHYINFNLKNFIKSENFRCSFRYLRDLNIRTHTLNKNWNYFHGDPFLLDVHENKLDLGRDILNNGTYWPVVISPIHDNRPDKFYVFEGGHRVVSLKLLALEGEVPDDFKILCLEFPCDYNILSVEQMYFPLKNKFLIRGSLETLYGCNILVDENKLKEVYQAIETDGNKLIDDYTLEYTANNYEAMIDGTQIYPHYLRDLIYTVREEIKPSPIINDEKIFRNWIDS